MNLFTQSTSIKRVIEGENSSTLSGTQSIGDVTGMVDRCAFKIFHMTLLSNMIANIVTKPVSETQGFAQNQALVMLPAPLQV